MNETKSIESPNIIFIILDALRPNNLGCYGYKRKTSPNIDNLSKQGVLFENAFSSHNSTNRCALDFLASRHLLINKKGFSYDKSELNSFFNSGGIFLQEILKKNGYKTFYLDYLYGWRKIGFDYYFKDSPKISFIKKIPFLSRILKDLFYKFGSKKMLNKIKFKRAGERITNEAIQIIKKEKKFFLVLHHGDTHMPYNYPSQFSKFFAENKSEKFFNKLSKNDEQFIKFCEDNFNKDSEINDIIAHYDNSILYDDFLTGKIIKTLKQENLFDNTIIVFFSDHGESISEHNICVDHHGLYDTSMHVPLILSFKDLPKNKKIKPLVALQDIVPTILSLAKIKSDSLFFDGKDLLPLISGKEKSIRESIFMEEDLYLKKRAIRTEKYKYMESPSLEEAFCSRCNNSHKGVLELYDLEKDPGEKENIAKKNPTLLMEMKLKLDNYIKEIKNKTEKRRIKKVLSEV